MLAVTSTETQSPEAWTRLESSPQWRALTDSQRIWVTQFLATGNALSATRAGYKTKSEANNRVLSYELAKNKSIVAALDVATGKIIPVKSEREILIETVRKQLRAAEKGSIAASKFTAQLERLQLGGKSDEVESDTGEAPKTSASDSTSRVPAGATALADISGVVRGYRTADGQYVQLADVEVTR